MHDFKALPHAQNKPNINAPTSANSSSVLVWDMEKPLDDPQIPHYFMRATDQYIIALVGFLEAQGVKVWYSDHKPPFTYTTSSQKPSDHFDVRGLILQPSTFHPGVLLISTVYTPNLENWDIELAANQVTVWHDGDDDLEAAIERTLAAEAWHNVRPSYRPRRPHLYVSTEPDDEVDGFDPDEWDDDDYDGDHAPYIAEEDIPF